MLILLLSLWRSHESITNLILPVYTLQLLDITPVKSQSESEKKE